MVGGIGRDDNRQVSRQTDTEAALNYVAVVACQAGSKTAGLQQMQARDKLHCHSQERSRTWQQRHMLRCWQQACMKQGKRAPKKTGQPPRSGSAGMSTARNPCASLAICPVTYQVDPDSSVSPQCRCRILLRSLSTCQVIPSLNSAMRKVCRPAIAWKAVGKGCVSGTA